MRLFAVAMQKPVDVEAQAFPKSWPQKIALGAPIVLLAGAAVSMAVVAIEHRSPKGDVLAWAVGAYIGCMIAAALAIVVFTVICRRDSNRALPYVALMVVLWMAAGFTAGRVMG
jgi:hypothetical protein